ncbi:hypothetical protein BCE_4792 [Bacillus cereus ATCC 10987]|uniref:Uncharacterized protein n=1 Tax=Bacillus cereus (strain ATCC 10987 / NRS 248) TaxID=222523 RepID=Q72Z77_BACC1|nr:hypothetical protein BCE_4792 [Bacillus cereus ATCC 10987]
MMNVFTTFYVSVLFVFLSLLLYRFKFLLVHFQNLYA